MGLSYLLPFRLGFLAPGRSPARPPSPPPGAPCPSPPLRRRNDARAFFTLSRFSLSSRAPSSSSSPSSTLSSISSPPQKEAKGGMSCVFTHPRDSGGTGRNG